MTVGLSDRLVQIRRGALVGIGIVVALFQLGGSLGLRINTSPSLPPGLYIITEDASASLIEFCPVEPFAALAIARGYRDAGGCRDGAAPLLKPVARLTAIALLLWLLPLPAFYFCGGDFGFWKSLVLFFTKTAFVTIGGSYTVIP